VVAPLPLCLASLAHCLLTIPQQSVSAHCHHPVHQFCESVCCSIVLSHFVAAARCFGICLLPDAPDTRLAFVSSSPVKFSMDFSFPNSSSIELNQLACWNDVVPQEHSHHLSPLTKQCLMTTTAAAAPNTHRRQMQQNSSDGRPTPLNDESLTEQELQTIFHGAIVINGHTSIGNNDDTNNHHHNDAQYGRHNNSSGAVAPPNDSISSSRVSNDSSNHKIRHIEQTMQQQQQQRHASVLTKCSALCSPSSAAMMPNASTTSQKGTPHFPSSSNNQQYELHTDNNAGTMAILSKCVNSKMRHSTERKNSVSCSRGPLHKAHSAAHNTTGRTTNNNNPSSCSTLDNQIFPTHFINNNNNNNNSNCNSSKNTVVTPLTQNTNFHSQQLQQQQQQQQQVVVVAANNNSSSSTIVNSKGNFAGKELQSTTQCCDSSRTSSTTSPFGVNSSSDSHSQASPTSTANNTKQAKQMRGGSSAHHNASQNSSEHHLENAIRQSSHVQTHLEKGYSSERMTQPTVALSNHHLLHHHHHHLYNCIQNPQQLSDFDASIAQGYYQSSSQPSTTDMNAALWNRYNRQQPFEYQTVAQFSPYFHNNNFPGSHQHNVHYSHPPPLSRSNSQEKHSGSVTSPSSLSSTTTNDQQGGVAAIPTIGSWSLPQHQHQHTNPNWLWNEENLHLCQTNISAAQNSIWNGAGLHHHQPHAVASHLSNSAGMEFVHNSGNHALGHTWNGTSLGEPCTSHPATTQITPATETSSVWQQQLFVYIESMPLTNLFCSRSQEDRYMILCGCAPTESDTCLSNNPPINLHSMMQRLTVSAVKAVDQRSNTTTVPPDTLSPYQSIVEFGDDIRTLNHNLMRCYCHDQKFVRSLSRYTSDVLDKLDELKERDVMASAQQSQVQESSIGKSIPCPEWRILDEDPCDEYLQWDYDDAEVTDCKSKIGSKKRLPNTEWTDQQVIRAHRKKEKLEHFHRTGSCVPIKKHSYHIQDPAPETDKRGNYEEMKRRVREHYFCVKQQGNLVVSQNAQIPALTVSSTDKDETKSANSQQSSPPGSLHVMEAESISRCAEDSTSSTTITEKSSAQLREIQIKSVSKARKASTRSMISSTARTTVRKRKRTSSSVASSTKPRSKCSKTVTKYDAESKRPRKKQKASPAQSSTDSKSFTFLQATIQVLKEQNRALSPEEIANEIVTRGLVETKGKTPKQTIAARCYSYIKVHQGDCEIRKDKPGTFAINESFVEKKR